MYKDTHSQIIFPLIKDKDGYPPFDTERLWAKKLPGNLYEVDSIPFYTKEASLGDVISATEENGIMLFDKVTIYSEINIVRVIFFRDTLAQDSNILHNILAKLKEIGCKYEVDLDRNLVSVAVINPDSYASLIRLLEEGFKNDELDYEESIKRV